MKRRQETSGDEADTSSQESSLNSEESIITKIENEPDIFRAIRGEDETELSRYNQNDDSLNIRNEEGNTPLHVAVSSGYLPAVKLLVEKGALPTIKNNKKRTPLSLALTKYTGIKIALYLLRNKKVKNKLLKHKKSIIVYLKLAKIAQKRAIKNKPLFKEWKKVIDILETSLVSKQSVGKSSTDLENPLEDIAQSSSSSGNPTSNEILNEVISATFIDNTQTKKKSLSTLSQSNDSAVDLNDSLFASFLDESEKEPNLSDSLCGTSLLDYSEKGQIENLNTQCSQEQYKKGGLSHSLPGVIYQLRLLVLFVLRGIKKFQEFSIATEMDKAEKFDDVVFKYREKKKSSEIDEMPELQGSCSNDFWTWRFLQAKHRHKLNSNIHTTDLFPIVKKNSTETCKEKETDPFSIPKYFISYWKITTHKEFSDDYMDEFTLCTNAKLNLNGKLSSKERYYENIDVKTFFKEEKVTEDDVVLFYKKSGFKAKKFQISNLVQATKILEVTLLQVAQIFLKMYELKDMKKYISNKLEYIKVVNTCLKISQEFEKLESSADKGLSKKHSLADKIWAYRDCFKDELTSLKKLMTELEDVALKPKNKQKEITSLRKKITIQCRTERENLNLKKEELQIQIKHYEKGILSADSRVIESDKSNLEAFKTQVLKQKLDTQLLTKNKELFVKVCKLKRYDGLKNTDRDKEWLINKIDDAVSNLSVLEFFLEKAPDRKNMIDKFCQKFSIVTEYYNVDILGSLLRDEFNVDIHFLSVDLAYNSLETEMLQWFKKSIGGNGTFLSEIDVENFVQEINQKIYSLFSAGLGLAYPEELRSYEIEFDSRNNNFIEIKDKMSSFVNEDNNQVLKFTTKSNLLTARKILQCLDEEKYRDTFQLSDGKIFLRLSTLITPYMNDLIMNSFASKENFNILVLDCACSSPKPEISSYIYSRIQTILEESSIKKVILITKIETQFVKEFEPIITKRDKDSSNFNYLTNKSQESILEKEIILQNRPLALSQLLDKTSANSVIEESILSRILPSVPIKVGNKKQFLMSDVFNKNYYISRQLKYNDTLIHEEELSCEMTVHKLVLIVGPSGSGKSTFLSNLSHNVRNKHPEFWIARINLNNFASVDHECSLHKINTSMSTLEVINFLVELLFSEEDYNYNKDFGKELLTFGINPELNVKHPKVVLLLDGFDEISEEYQNNIVFSIKLLIQTKIVQIVVTSDLYAKSKLLDIDLRSVPSRVYELTKFSQEQQIKFLMSYWDWSIYNTGFKKSGAAEKRKWPEILNIKKSIFKAYPRINKTQWCQELPEQVLERFCNEYISQIERYDFFKIPEHNFILAKKLLEIKFKNIEVYDFYEHYVITKLENFHKVKAKQIYGNKEVDKRVTKSNKDFFKTFSDIASSPCFNSELLDDYKEMISIGLLDNITSTSEKKMFNYTSYYEFFLAHHFYTDLSDNNFKQFFDFLEDQKFLLMRKVLNDLLTYYLCKKCMVKLKQSELWSNYKFKEHLKNIDLEKKENILFKATEEINDNIFKTIVNNLCESDLDHIIISQKKVMFNLALKTNVDVFKWTIDWIKNQFKENYSEQITKSFIKGNGDNILCHVIYKNIDLAKLVQYLEHAEIEEAILKKLLNASQIIDVALDTEKKLSNIETLMWLLDQMKYHPKILDKVLCNTKKVLFITENNQTKVTWFLSWIKLNAKESPRILRNMLSFNCLHWALRNLPFEKVKDLLNWVSTEQVEHLNEFLSAKDESDNSILQLLIYEDSFNSVKKLLLWIKKNGKSRNILDKIIKNNNSHGENIYHLVFSRNNEEEIKFVCSLRKNGYLEKDTYKRMLFQQSSESKFPIEHLNDSEFKDDIVLTYNNLVKRFEFLRDIINNIKQFVIRLYVGGDKDDILLEIEKFIFDMNKH